MENDPRMGELYIYYLTRWFNEIGDLITLYSDFGGVSQYGAWGMLQYIGQDPMATAKSAAVQTFLNALHQVDH